MAEDMHIVYAADDQFAEILGVSLTSLYENNKNINQIYVYILETQISENNKSRLESLSASYGRSKIIWVPAIDISKTLQVDVSIDRGSMSQYSRLFVSSVLPQNLEKVLYLDCDIIIERSLLELWNLDMQGKTIAALMDSFSRWYRMNIGLEPEDIMFNSGVMLIDLKRWRDQNIEKKLLNFICCRKGKIQQGDQGALNAVLAHDVYCFEPRFNSVTIFYDFNYDEMLMYRKPPEFYSRELVSLAIEKPVIIHFTTSFLSRRPWVEGCCHKYVGEWMKYKNMSPWKEFPLWEYKQGSCLNKVFAAFLKKLPRNVAVFLSGLLQAYGRPLFYRIIYFNWTKGVR
ncbi:MAG: glycosyltransferase family 8 protein [Lachnospiraceae bacterium]|nr:glycosyltransferase family 8 protein [Lachnospiraceae bacterium]